MDRQQIVLLLIPFGFLALLLLDDHEEACNPHCPDNPTGNPSKGKEVYYLQYNKDELFKNLLACEGHFRNIEVNGIDTEGSLNCAVKHLADAEGHGDEAISHSLFVVGEEKSEKFKGLRDSIRDLRHDLQKGDLSTSEGTKRVRQIRREFEKFNPDFDISKCSACEIPNE